MHNKKNPKQTLSYGWVIALPKVVLLSYIENYEAAMRAPLSVNFAEI